MIAVGRYRATRLRGSRLAWRVGGSGKRGCSRGRPMEEMKFRAGWTWPWGPPFIVSFHFISLRLFFFSFSRPSVCFSRSLTEILFLFFKVISVSLLILCMSFTVTRKQSTLDLIVFYSPGMVVARPYVLVHRVRLILRGGPRDGRDDRSIRRASASTGAAGGCARRRLANSSATA